MLLQKLYLANATETVDIRVTDGKFEAIAPQLEPLPGEEVVADCAGKMLSRCPAKKLLRTAPVK